MHHWQSLELKFFECWIDQLSARLPCSPIHCSGKLPDDVELVGKQNQDWACRPRKPLWVFYWHLLQHIVSQLGCIEWLHFWHKNLQRLNPKELKFGRVSNGSKPFRNNPTHEVYILKTSISLNRYTGNVNIHNRQ